MAAIEKDNSVTMVSDSLTTLGSGTVVPPMREKITVIGDWLVGTAGFLDYCQFYIRGLEAEYRGGNEDLSDPFLHRKIQESFALVSKLPGGEGLDDNAVHMLLARHGEVWKVTQMEIPHQVPWAAVGCGDRIAYHFMNKGCKGKWLPKLLEIGAEVASSDVFVGGPFFSADTNTLKVVRH